MASMQFQAITHFLASSLILLFSVSAAACGWGDDAETLRLAFFRAQVGNMAKFSPFFYSEHYFNEYEIYSKTDRWRNCAEWQKKIGERANLKDIYALQYDTEPEKFQLSYHNHTLLSVFSGNTFIHQLLRPENKLLLEYFAFAKEMEYKGNPQKSKWESWDDVEPRDYWDDEEPTAEFELGSIENKLAAVTDEFLKQRYAFMLIRYGRQKNVVKLYDRYFSDSNNKSVLQSWALLFKAYCTANKAEQNYYLSRVFDTCEEKVIAVMQWYNFDKVTIKETLKFAKNDRERAVILAIPAMKNPAPCLEDIKRIYTLWPDSDYANMLIGREINKLEDWIFSPQMENTGPDQDISYGSGEEYAKARRVNYIKDMNYLRVFRAFLIKIYSDEKGESHDYLAAGIAHLSFMDDQIDDGNTFANSISNTATASVLTQKYTEIALVAVRQGNLNDIGVKQQLYNTFSKMLSLAQKDNSYGKSVFSLLRVLAGEYNKHGDMATAGLLFLKSENFKYSSGGYGEYFVPDDFGDKPDYMHLSYFDIYATTGDMDNLIALIDKKKKTPFENFICEGTTTSRYFYLDLKGTIALRQDNLQLAYETYKLVPDSFYENNWYYSAYLNEDPFYPRILNYALKERKFDYKFNKAKFVKQIIDLQTKTDPGSYLKLANAYYNISDMGNAWIMLSYYQGNIYYETIFGSMGKAEQNYNGGNYLNRNVAAKYYKMAFIAAKDDEQRAMASLMLYVCSNESDYSNTYYWEKPAKHPPGKWLNEFYGKYNNTATFKRYSCPDLEYYLK